MSASTPLVSVIMPAYNVEKYVADSIQSILNQTYQNWELLVINDGSTDKTESIIAGFAGADSRIKHINNKKNEGLIYTRNRGLALAQGKYIANLDSDDLALPHRIAVQSGFMENNPDYVLQGAAAELIDSNGLKTGIEKRNIPDIQLHSLLLFSNYFINSSVIITAKLAKQIRYSPDIPLAEDYYLFAELSKHGKIGNDRSINVKYRIHEQNISKEKSEEMNVAKLKIQEALLRQLRIIPKPDELALHFKLVKEAGVLSKPELKETEAWLLKIKAANETALLYTPQLLNHWCAFFYKRACLKTGLGVTAYRHFKKSALSKSLDSGLKSNLTFFVKSILNKKIN